MRATYISSPSTPKSYDRDAKKINDQVRTYAHWSELSSQKSNALHIYHCKRKVASSTALSKLFVVGEKAFRDIWTGRTWSWQLNESRSSSVFASMVRPIGRKDAQSRKPRSFGPITEICSSQSFDESNHVYPKTRSTWAQVHKKFTDEAPPSVFDVAVELQIQLIDKLRHYKKTQFGFDAVVWPGMLSPNSRGY